ncbi:MAG TPA: Sua5 family C-terminal domain-containing protein, partial [Usitatibacter sp.]
SPVLLRPGAVTREDIARVMGVEPRDRDAEAPRAPGTLDAHYAPQTAMTLVSAASLDLELRSLTNVAVLALHEAPYSVRVTTWIDGGSDSARYGHDLYANLRKLDGSGAKRILVEAPPRTVEWEAVNDRLDRAAAGAGLLDDEP